MSAPKCVSFGNPKSFLQSSLPKILIVDDANFNVYSLKTILENFFYLESDSSYSGKDAIKMIKDRHERSQ